MTIKNAIISAFPFLSKKPAEVDSIEKILADFRERVTRLRRVADTHFTEAVANAEEAQALLAKVEVSKANNEAANKFANNIEKLIS
jgi:uncharacterized protein YciW